MGRLYTISFQPYDDLARAKLEIGKMSLVSWRYEEGRVSRRSTRILWIVKMLHGAILADAC